MQQQQQHKYLLLPFFGIAFVADNKIAQTGRHSLAEQHFWHCSFDLIYPFGQMTCIFSTISACKRNAPDFFFFLKNFFSSAKLNKASERSTANLIKMAKAKRGFTEEILLHKSRWKRISPARTPNAREMMKLMRDCFAVMAFQN